MLNMKLGWSLWTCGCRACECPKPQIYFPWRMQHENILNTHVSAYCCQSLGSTLTCINMKTVKFYVQPAIKHHIKCLGTPDCKYMENMSIDFIWLNVQMKYLVQTNLCHFKWEMALCKWPKCPLVHAANLVANSGTAAFGADVIGDHRRTAII